MRKHLIFSEKVYCVDFHFNKIKKKIKKINIFYKLLTTRLI